MRNFLAIIAVSLIIFSCGKDSRKDQHTDPQSPAAPPSATVLNEPPGSPAVPDPHIQEKTSDLKPSSNMPDEPMELKGVNLTTPLLGYMIRKGQKVYDGACVSCHSLDGSASNASSFAGITKRRAPEWIMNMTTGVDLKNVSDDRRERSRLQGCYTRQPGQRLNIEQSRDLLEFLRKNDGEE